jgi:hypothetical protein
MVDATEDEIKKMEIEIKEKELHAEQEKARSMERLLDEAVNKGKDEALKSFKAEQDRTRAEEERKALTDRTAALEAELRRTQEASIKKIEELSKSMEEKLQTLEARPKGISRNESPFGSAQPSQTNIHGLSAEELKQIERNSMDAFYAKLGRPAPY